VNVHKNAKLTPPGRAEFVARVLVEDQSVVGVGRSMGVSPGTVRKWVRRRRLTGLEIAAHLELAV
jgi:transposase-like protein